jgi:protein-S-isoprenylcysteine O-methyltransferase Ste14
MAAIAHGLPGATVFIPARLPLAIGFVVAGGFVALAGVHAFRQNRTTVNPLTPEQSSSLVTSGVYRFSRNPMYLGFLLALAGWCVYLGNWASALLLPVFVACINRFQIAPEERALRAQFGPRFTMYASTVRRWL